MALDASTLATSYQMAHPNDQVHMDVDYFDSTIESQGVRFVHFRAIPCPVGLGDRYDIRRTHEDHSGCSNGFIYEQAGEVSCLFVGNGKNNQWNDVGMIGDSTVQVTIPRFYADKVQEEVLLSPYDRLYLKEAKAKVVHFQKFEHNQSGFDRTSYPIESVELLIDSNGVRYAPGDYSIVNGQIKWTSNHRPGMDPGTAKGQICAIRYRYIPFWYVSRILHEIRLIQAEDTVTESIGTQRMPYSVQLQREYMFENEQNDVRAPNPNSPRQAVAPRSGTFGPR
jgi:hypothetical protein